MKMDILCKIRDIYRLIYEFENQFSSEYGVGLNEGMLLCSIYKDGRCSSGEIAELLGISASNCSKIIISVEKKGLIERIVGIEDRRQMYFKLTPKGEGVFEIIRSDSYGVEKLLDQIKEI